MSKVWKGLKKAFKVVLKVVKVVAIVVVIAAAVYFTAGAAASAFGALAAGTAGTAVGSMAAAAQTFFTAIQGYAGAYLKGVGALWKSGVQAFTGQAAGTAASTAVTTGAPAITPSMTYSVGGVAQTATAAAPTVGSVAANVAGQEAIKEGTKQGLLGSLKDMSVTDKLLLAKTGVDVVGGFTAPTEKEKAEAQKTFVGSFYGRNADGSGGGVVDIQSGTAAPVFTPEAAKPAPTAQQLFEERTSVATNPEGKVFDPKRAATQPLDLFQPAYA